MPCFKTFLGEGRPKVFPVYKKLVSIGSATLNDIRVEAEGVEEHHAQLVFDGRDFHVSEIAGKGAMSINGKKKRRSKLFHNDRLGLGSAELVFSIYEETLPLEEAQGGDIAAELEGMRRLSDFNQRLMALRSVPEQLDALVDAVIEVTHADKGFVILLEEGQPRVTVARNVAQENLPDGVRHLSDSILRKVIESRRPLIVSDALRDEAFRSSESVMNLKLCSVMCAPLVAQGQLLGLIYVGNDRVASLFENSSLDVLTVFAGQASLILQTAILLDQLVSDRDQLAEQLQDKHFGDIIGSCPSLMEVFKKVAKVATTDISVLITGETGTGKELIARELHRRSPRAEGPFVVINCGAITENLMESELFGHVRGAFTGAIATRPGKFQQANGGTLFLDEIGELPLALQVKLLRALQERVVTKVGENRPESVDIRVLAATHRDLEEEIRTGRFREDLYYRLNVVNLRLPALRERGDDVLLIAKYLLAKYSKEYEAKVKGFSREAVAALRKYEWPGNIRQLENRIKKAVVLAESQLLEAEDLELFPEALAAIMPLAQAKEEFQRRYVLEILERNNGNRTKTARDLDVDPRTIFRYLERESVPPEPGGATSL